MVYNKKKILYVTSRFPALSMTFVANEMKGVVQAGYDINVATIWNPLPNHKGHPNEIPFLDKVIPTTITPKLLLQTVWSMLRKPKVLVSIIKLIPGHLKSPWLFAKLLAAIPKGIYLGRYLVRNEHDLIHAHFLSTPTTVALIASAYSNTIFTCTAHAFDITSTNPRITTGSIKYKLNQASTVITISNYNKKDILSRWPTVEGSKIVVIYNGIDTGNYLPDPNPKYLSDLSNIKILCISNLNPKKGYRYLIEAIGILVKRNRQVQLDIFGVGPQLGELEDLISSNSLNSYITLNGAINQADAAPAIRDNDIFVLASIPLASGDADGLPTVLIESLSCAIPTISTQVTGIPEIIIENETGQCVPAENAEAIANAVEWIIENPEDAKRMGLAGRELVLRQFDHTKSAATLVGNWESLINKKEQLSKNM